jgi:hypothetical protein
MNFSFLPLFAVLFFTCISCSNSDQTSELELKKLEIEKKKLELEEKKLDHEMEQLLSTEQPKEKHSLEQPNANSEEFDFLNGEWYGSIGQKEIKIIIQSVNGNQLKGYNLVGKNKRPVQGTVTKLNVKRKATCQSNYCGYYKVVLSEPGDHKWDGVFTLEFEATSIDGAEENGIIYWFHVGEGQWKSYDGKMIHVVNNLKNL